MKQRVRFLPLTIAVATVLLGLKLGVLWLSSGTAQAQQQPPAQTPPAPAPAAAATPAAAPAAAKPQEPAAAKGAEAPAAADSQDVTNLSGSEIAVLQQLAARRAEIEKRSSDLDRREAVLKAAEERINAKILELKKLQASVEQAIGTYDANETKRLENLVKIYETMKPAEAARIFEQMDLPTLVGLVERMNTRKVAPILAAMNPVRAKQVTTELTKRRQPGDTVAAAETNSAPAAQPTAAQPAPAAPIPATALPPGVQAPTPPLPTAQGLPPAPAAAKPAAGG